jgi:hypothetical protein
MVVDMANIHTMAFSMAQLSIGSFGNREGEIVQQQLIDEEMELMEQSLVSIELKLN